MAAKVRARLGFGRRNAQKSNVLPRVDFYTPGLIPVHKMPEFGIEWAEVFEGVYS
ncbi:hypothetical protein KBK19_12355 [Microvirga sp. STR05]|uniref:Uncharacterized protein n=1 Tax=Hymenobacter duratus TaxID=2771356 RepID=A0ABR8JJE4_9BACT|nr:hypothetical protein [Hymenobacter duratus]MBD2715828.1 hypothetical protein [Hymenobacter duratus]MBR7950739.1 hypothetical protein [Microvirga sp. STR05]